MSFSLDLAKFAEKTKRTTTQAYGQICLELATRMTMRSPVDTGMFRGNWQMGDGGIDSRKDSPVDKQPLGAAPSAGSFTRWQDQLEGIRAGYSIVYITNSLPYARHLEYGLYGNPQGSANGSKTTGGFSKQAPAGIVRVTLVEYQQIVKAAIEKAKE